MCFGLRDPDLIVYSSDRDDDDLDHDEAYETLEVHSILCPCTILLSVTVLFLQTQVSTKKIHQAFSTVKRVQSHLRARESRHRETVEFNKMQVAVRYHDSATAAHILLTCVAALLRH